MTDESVSLAAVVGLPDERHCPRRIEFVAALPMTATGKFLRRELVRFEAAH